MDRSVPANRSGRGMPHAPCLGFNPPLLGEHGGIVNITLKTGLCAGAIALGLAACNKSRPPEHASATSEARDTEGGSAVESIAEARCARESRCDNIGSEKKYSSMEDCVARVRDDWKGDLDARSCLSGVNETQLKECVGAIRAEECSSPFDTLERISACTPSQICAD
jgi:hypothetical protein